MPNPCQEGLEVCPVDQGCTEIVLKDDDGNEQIADLAELRNREGILDPNNASLNIDHSQDVIVGPVTQFYAPVTIYQHVNGHINGRVQTQEDDNKVVVETPVESPTHPQTPPKFPSAGTFFKKRRKKIVELICKYFKYWFPLVIVTVIATTILSILLLVEQEDESDYSPTETPDQSETTSDNTNDEKWLLEKKDWHGKETQIPLNLTHPVPLIIISHTGTEYCDNLYDCQKEIKKIQMMHMNLGFLDIGYNYLIAGDGHVYTGRGSNLQNYHWNHKDTSLAISFVGDFNKDALTADMICVFLRLMDYLDMSKVLSDDYILVAHNQTYQTMSPGENVYAFIKLLQHFNSSNFVSDQNNSSSKQTNRYIINDKVAPKFITSNCIRPLLSLVG